MLTTIATEPLPRIHAPHPAPHSNGLHVLGETLLRGALIRERRRADRSNEPLALLLVRLATASAPDGVQEVISALISAKRDTDIVGWFEHGRTLAVIMPEVSPADDQVPGGIEERFRGAIESRLIASVIEEASMRYHVETPRTAERADAGRDVDGLIEAIQPRQARTTVRDVAKRALDIAGGLALLTVLSPIFAVIAALIKLTSPGPIFFRQERIGQGMRRFRMLKFRSMHVNSDSAIHHQFVSSFIKSGAQAQEAGKQGMFKLTNDPRVTPIGGILRKTSLDELPQFWNVLRGDMSLVGPRPPLQYEVDQYQSWHCRRVLDAKPGITGLWQVKGRSRTTFDEMVRLDLRYAKKRSLWTDVKILLATPAAVIAGKGAA